MSEEEQETDIDTDQLTLITQKERNMSRARGDSMVKLTANRETLFHRASEQAEFASTVGKVNLSWMETAPLLYADDAQSQRILNIQDYKQFLTITWTSVQ